MSKNMFQYIYNLFASKGVEISPREEQTEEQKIRCGELQIKISKLLEEYPDIPMVVFSNVHLKEVISKYMVINNVDYAIFNGIHQPIINEPKKYE